MTDKQIIIDGVDVSGCEFAPKEIGWCNNGNLSSYCKDNPNCYYKQLKAKEQECEELKRTVDDLLHKPEIQDKILWKIDNEALLGSKDAWIYKLEKTLAEIKEIATCCIEGDVARIRMKQILQKISECEVEDGR